MSMTGTTSPIPQDSEWSLLVKILEVLGGGGYAPSSISPYSGTSGLQTIPTSGGAFTVGNVVPVMDAQNPDQLSYYQLKAGVNSSSPPEIILPSDYNASTNAVFWKLVL